MSMAPEKTKKPASAQQNPARVTKPDASGKRADAKRTPEVFKATPLSQSLAAASISAPAIPIASANPYEPLNNTQSAPPSTVPSWASRVAQGAKTQQRDKSKPPPQKPKANREPLVPRGEKKAVPVMAPRPKRPKQDAEALEALKEQAPELAEMVEQQMKQSDRDLFTIELVCAPDPSWKTAESSHAPDLNTYEVEKDLLGLLSAASNVGDTHDIALEAINSVKIEGNIRRKFFYSLSCTSMEALNNIIESEATKEFKGYSIAYFQQKESVFGYRFQYSLRALPAPFSNYQLIDWVRVLTSQGWDTGSITHICIGKRVTPGEPNKITGMLDIYVKPEACSNHGCDGALEYAGTSRECLGKRIEYPPSNILLGRNPSPDAALLMRSTDPEFMVGQYYTEEPMHRPEEGKLNKLLESNVGVYLDHNDIGKTWIKKTIKIGHCALCWGPRHESRNDPCMYKDTCRECLGKYKEMPHSGFHHSCKNMVVSTPKPETQKEKRKRDGLDEYNPGQPKSAHQAQYVPSQAHLKRQKLLEEAKILQQKRKFEEESTKEQEEDFTDYEGPELTPADIEWQNNQLAGTELEDI